MVTRRKLKLGTRRSLLAWAQSGWVAREVERLNPGVEVELVGIDTRGDRALDVPLRSVEGKEFFVAELDHALKSGQVDLTVHSMKDLSLERPRELVLAAVPRRENPRDVLLLGPGGQRALREGRRVRIGTSSPRRLENIPQFLRQALPRWQDPAREPDLEFVEIRGNVNTRLGRVLEEVTHERHLGGVVLAFAGLIRLWADEKARSELERLLEGVRWMVLPLPASPTNPGQGALAVECRADDRETRELLARVHDPETARHAERERRLLAEWGGGCHQRFGATSVRHAELGDLLYIRGTRPDGRFEEELRWPAPPAPEGAARPWDGSRLKTPHQPLEPGRAAGELAGQAVFVASPRAAATPGIEGALRDARVWVTGDSTWFALASRGIWVEGSGDGLGHEALWPIAAEPVLRLPPAGEWRVLTHERAVADWKGRTPHVIATYRLGEPALDEGQKRELAQATHLWWGSGSQFDALRAHASPGADHACGAGKSAAHLRRRGISPRVFPSVKEWRRWLGI